MKIIIAYPIPMDSEECWNIFRPFVKRFCDSMRANYPGIDYEIAAIVNSPEYELDERLDRLKELAQMFEGLPWKRYHYKGAGFDIGSFQWFARQQTENIFQVNCVTRVYAWRSRWLSRLFHMRMKFGNGLYGTSASREGGKLHCCTRCYAMDSDDFQRYPHDIVSRDQGTFFEVYDGSIFDWFYNQKLPTKIVNWHACNDVERFDWSINIYRDSTQNNCLVFDKHTDYYKNAEPKEKARLERMCFQGLDS